MSVEKLFEQFVQSGLYLRAWSPKTAILYRQAFQNFQRFQQSLRETPEPPNESGKVISKAQLEAWVVWMRQSGKTPAGCNIYICVFNAFSSWLKEQGHVREHLRLAKLKNHPKPVQVLSEAEIRLLLSRKPKRLLYLRTWTFILMLLDTGCRIDEILSLPRAGVDFDNLLLTVIGKGNKTRKIPFSSEGRKHLWTFCQKWEARNGKHPLLFSTERGNGIKYRNAYRDLKACFRVAGVEGEHIHPHNLRHTFACTYIKRGGSVVALSRILGHSSITTTQTYLRGLQIDDFGEARHLSPLSQR